MSEKNKAQDESQSTKGKKNGGKSQELIKREGLPTIDVDIPMPKVKPAKPLPLSEETAAGAPGPSQEESAGESGSGDEGGDSAD